MFLLPVLFLAACGGADDGSGENAPGAIQRDADGRILPSAATITGTDLPIPSDWKGRMDMVRGRLNEMEAAHADRNEALAKAAWGWAYQENFEPNIEALARGRVDARELDEVEYTFGRLLVALDSPDHARVSARRGELDTRLQALVVKLEALGPPTVTP